MVLTGRHFTELQWGQLRCDGRFQQRQAVSAFSRQSAGRSSQNGRECLVFSHGHCTLGPSVLGKPFLAKCVQETKEERLFEALGNVPDGEVSDLGLYADLQLAV